MIFLASEESGGGSKSKDKLLTRVTKFVPENESDEDDDEYNHQRPPTGMPNPKDHQGQKMDFLSVPTILHVDDDSVSTVSAETTTLFTKSSSSSTINLNSMENRSL